MIFSNKKILLVRWRRRSRMVVAAFLCLLVAHNTVAAVKLASIEIDGATKQQKENILAYVGDIERDQLGDVFKLSGQITEKANTAMQALGYFEAKFSVKARNGALQITVTPGQPTRITSATVAIIGEGSLHPALIKVKKTGTPGIGEIFESAKYDALKGSLIRTAQRNGFLDAIYAVQNVVVDTLQRTAAISLQLDTGSQYHFGEFTFEGSAIKPAIVLKLANWSADSAYNAAELTALQKRLLDTRYFQSVLFERNVDSANAVVDVHAKITMAKANKLITGIGYGTDTGPRAKLGWDKPWINPSGHSMNFEIAGSAIRNSFTTSYQVPSRAKRDAFWKAEFSVAEEDYEDTRSTQENIGLGYVTPLANGWKGSIFTKYLLEQFTQGTEEGRSELLMPGVNANITRSRGGLIPSSGYRYSLTLEGANDTLLSDASFFRVSGNSRWLQSYGKHRILYGLQFGGIFVYDSTTLSDIPSSLRFFAGGDQSVRGYDYKSLSPRDANDELTGGKYLAVARTEYGYRFAEHWRATLFVDGGSAFNDASDKFYVGPGVGLHWLSPIGAVRFDFGVAASEDNRIELHIALGPEL